MFSIDYSILLIMNKCLFKINYYEKLNRSYIFNYVYGYIILDMGRYGKDVDRLDIKILSLLAENSRLSAREISRRLKISVGTVQARLKRLEDLKIIKGYTIDINWESLGYSFPVLIDVKVSKGMLRYVEESVAKDPNVTSVYDITGEYDIAIIAWFRSRHELDNFVKKLQSMEYVERTHTKLILNIIVEGVKKGLIESFLE